VAPDGRRIEILELGPVVAYDLPEYGASVKVKAIQSVFHANTVKAWGVAVGWIKKFN
jgi:hypothetical protein